MLAQVYRLTTDEDFARVAKEGLKLSFPFFSLGAFKRKDNETPRFGFVVSTKVSKKAVVRNKVKRALREAIRQNLSYLKGGYDIVFWVKSKAERAYTDQLMAEVKVALAKGQLFKQWQK